MDEKIIDKTIIEVTDEAEKESFVDKAINFVSNHRTAFVAGAGIVLGAIGGVVAGALLGGGHSCDSDPFLAEDVVITDGDDDDSEDTDI